MNSEHSTASFIWKSLNAIACPESFNVLNDQSSASEALNIIRSGQGILWQGDYYLAKQMLVALTKRVAMGKKNLSHEHKSLAQQFHTHRLQLTQQHQLLNRLCIQIEPDFKVSLKKAPQVSEVLKHVWGTTDVTKSDPSNLPWRVSLKEFLGWIGAYEWYKSGIPIAQLSSADSAKIHPHFGVFAPSRKDYLQAIANAPLPASKAMVFDIGVGTGVLSAILLTRGMQKAVCTDLESRSLVCAQDNLQRLNLIDRCTFLQTDLFPTGLADLIICNPPWLPGKARSPLERAVFDENSYMLKGYLAGLRYHLKPQGEGWLIMSDLAERLGLRGLTQIDDWLAEFGLELIERHRVQASHGKTQNLNDPFHQARANEIISLWRIGDSSNV